ncbi:hypothetical protein EDD37DRAFT_358265 [Exophiala viscosa]|uniref:uncharacterized protein n=1 Tax=Exophiala viscosa TaxID=2486360 RepID=UPI0021A194E1|nr:hypothetical protein EDD37DRAFT_358265 [Exophiala viscosa]
MEFHCGAQTRLLTYCVLIPGLHALTIDAGAVESYIPTVDKALPQVPVYVPVCKDVISTVACQMSGSLAPYWPAPDMTCLTGQSCKHRPCHVYALLRNGNHILAITCASVCAYLEALRSWTAICILCFAGDCAQATCSTSVFPGKLEIKGSRRSSVISASYISPLSCSSSFSYLFCRCIPQACRNASASQGPFVLLHRRARSSCPQRQLRAWGLSWHDNAPHSR